LTSCSGTGPAGVLVRIDAIRYARSKVDTAIKVVVQNRRA